SPPGSAHRPARARRRAPSGTASRAARARSRARFRSAWWAGKAVRSVVEQWLQVSRIDVGLVVPLVAGVDRLGDGLALGRLDGRLDTLVPDTDGILRDRTCHETAADRVLLLLACVVSDHDHLALLLELLDRVDHSDGGALVGAEHALE